MAPGSVVKQRGRRGKGTQLDTTNDDTVVVRRFVATSLLRCGTVDGVDSVVVRCVTWPLTLVTWPCG